MIAIIAILAAILFPVFARARENARRSSCQSNLKQIGLGLIQYSQDYDERVPRSWFGTDRDTSGVGGRYKWMDAIYPYVKSEQIFICPSDTLGVLPNANSPYKYHPGDGSNGRGYDYGSYGGNKAYSSTTSSPFSSEATLSSFATPATTVWVSETTPIVTTSDGYSPFEFSWANDTTQPNVTTFNGKPNLERITARHLDTVVVLYCDGHVKSLKLTALAAKNAAGIMPAFTIQED